MAVIRQKVPASTKELFVHQWLFTIVETNEQEQDAGRLVYIAQATGKRMTRRRDGKFVGLDGSAVTETDLAEGFLTPTIKGIRLEMSIGFDGDDEQARVGDLKEALTARQFNQIRRALVMISKIALDEKVGDIEGGTLDETQKSPLEEM